MYGAAMLALAAFAGPDLAPTEVFTPDFVESVFAA